MKVFDLCCEADHRFEGWFASEAEYERQIAESLVECPFCGSRSLRKMLSAPRLNLSHSQAERAAPEPAAHPSQMARDQIQAMWMQMARQIIESTEDVGARFAEEARKFITVKLKSGRFAAPPVRTKRPHWLTKGSKCLPCRCPPLSRVRFSNKCGCGKGGASSSRTPLFARIRFMTLA